MKHHGQRVARKLDELYNPRLPERLKIDFWLLMQAILELFQLTCDKLMGAEHHLVGERGNDTKKLKQRDADAGLLHDAILAFRDAFQGIYRPLNVEEFGFPRQVGRLAFDLLRQGEFLLEILGRPGLVLPEPLFGEGIDLAKEVAKIEALVNQLRLSIAEADAELKLAQAAKVDKDDAQSNWDSLFPWGGRIITGLFFLAGESHLARFILPSVRRPGRTRQIARQERLEETGVSPSPSHGEPAGGEDGDTASDGTETGDTAPDGTSPGNTAPGDTSPGDTSPGDTAPGDTPTGDDSTAPVNTTG